MSREIPEVVRAAAGLAATVVDEARRLPETLPGLPVRLIGLAMQHAMKLQQQYAGFVARGDELFTGIRGEDEPGLATFDDDLEADAVPAGFRESAFDRAGDSLLTDPVDEARSTIDELAEEAPTTDEVLDELAIDDLVEDIPLSAGPDALLGDAAPAADAPVTEDADAVESALLESDRAVGEDDAADDSTTVDVLTPAGEVASVDATVTDEGVAAPEAPEAPAPATATPAAQQPAKKAAAKKAAAKKAPAKKAPATEAPATEAPATEAPATEAPATEAPATTVDAPAAVTTPAESLPADTTPADTTATADSGTSGEASASTAPATAPVDGYDDFSVAQLRGRLRGYQLATVADLIAYEEATKARPPYLTMLRNRVEKLEEQAVESSPLAPRG